jgi:hypothetical protein
MLPSVLQRQRRGAARVLTFIRGKFRAPWSTFLVLRRTSQSVVGQLSAEHFFSRPSGMLAGPQAVGLASWDDIGPVFRDFSSDGAVSTPEQLLSNPSVMPAPRGHIPTELSRRPRDKDCLAWYHAPPRNSAQASCVEVQGRSGPAPSCPAYKRLHAIRGPALVRLGGLGHR